LFGDPSLELIEAPALIPSEITMDQNHIQQLQREEQEAANQVLPDGDDDL